MKTVLAMFCLWLAAATSSTGAEPNPLQRLTIPTGGGDIVVEFSLTNDFAEAYLISSTNASKPDEKFQFDSGTPANLNLQLDRTGKVVVCLNFGGMYMSTLRVVMKDSEDGTTYTNNPVAIYNGQTQCVIEAWNTLRKKNKSFKTERLENKNDPTKP